MNQHRRDEFGVHPAASLFPLLTGAALDELVEDIRQNGLIHPIVLDTEGRVIDGRNRLAACKLAGIEPRFEQYTGDDPLSYVVSANAKRRNMNKAQLAITAARAWLQAEAEGLTRPNGGDARALVGNRQLIREARKHFAGMFGVSHDSVYSARRISDTRRIWRKK